MAEAIEWIKLVGAIIGAVSGAVMFVKFVIDRHKQRKTK